MCIFFYMIAYGLIIVKYAPRGSFLIWRIENETNKDDPNNNFEKPDDISMEDFDHLLCEKHLNNETLELISAGKFKENGPFFFKLLKIYQNYRFWANTKMRTFSGNWVQNFALNRIWVSRDPEYHIDLTIKPHDLFSFIPKSKTSFLTINLLIQLGNNVYLGIFRFNIDSGVLTIVYKVVNISTFVVAKWLSLACNDKSVWFSQIWLHIPWAYSCPFSLC